MTAPLVLRPSKIQAPPLPLLNGSLHKGKNPIALRLEQTQDGNLNTRMEMSMQEQKIITWMRLATRGGGLSLLDLFCP